MNKIRFLLTLTTLCAISYGILEVKNFLDQNFIDNETPVKQALNRFLNGEQN